MRPTPAAVAALAWGLLLSLQACATPEPVVYGPIGEAVRFGYKDQGNADGGHTVLVVLPPQTQPGEARAYWDRRAEELCPGGVSKRIVFRSERKEIMSPAAYVQYTASFSSRIATAYELEGYVYCKVAAPAAKG
ncbi:MAG TPA: hypothetical protein VGC92_01005 [Phenylobacterium sp.]